jgi:hypothetical protein
MKTYLLASQYLENYETRFKFKSGRNFVVDAPCLASALALVQDFLLTERDALYSKYTNIEFPIIPPMDGSVQYEFENASHAIAEIPEWERDENIRLRWLGKGDYQTFPQNPPSPCDAPTEHDSPARLEQVNELPSDES